MIITVYLIHSQKFQLRSELAHNGVKQKNAIFKNFLRQYIVKSTMATIKGFHIRR